VQEGSRVRIEGLQAKPQHNGRTGAICSGFNQESGRWIVAVDASDAGPAFQIAIRPANLTPLPAIDIDVPQRPSALSSSSSMCNPPAKALQQGSRVRIEGLQAAPQMNGRMGVVCGGFDEEAGRWTVDVAAEGARPACRGTFRAANLRLIAPHNFSTEWVDEDGRVWRKNVDFSRECAKGHALVLLGDCGGEGGGEQLMCRLCHSFCRRDSDEAARWLTCSVVAGCCGGYAVCCSCASALNTVAAVVPAGSDDLHTLVSCGGECLVLCQLTLIMQGVGLPYLSWLRSTLGSSLGRMTTSQFCQMYVRPFTWRSRGSVTERLMARVDTAQHVGDATWFISHTWSNAFADTLDAVLLFFEGREDAGSARLWFDVMVTSQHVSTGPSKPPSFWMSTFKDSIARIGGLLLVVDVWDNPTALQRAW
jgi:hypothetical protein